VPLYYDRDRDGLPREWIARMKRGIRTLGWRFSAERMVMDYVLKAYIPAAGGTSSDMRGLRDRQARQLPTTNFQFPNESGLSGVGSWQLGR
jgi:glucan phosphorylase